MFTRNLLDLQVGYCFSQGTQPGIRPPHIGMNLSADSYTSAIYSSFASSISHCIYISHFPSLPIVTIIQGLLACASHMFHKYSSPCTYWETIYAHVCLFWGLCMCGYAHVYTCACLWTWGCLSNLLPHVFISLPPSSPLLPPLLGHVCPLTYMQVNFHLFYIFLNFHFYMDFIPTIFF